MAKGLAIILVVIGHTIQARNPDFDEQLWFRVIYSFHMPFFVFLSGAVAAFWFDPSKLNSLNPKAALSILLNRSKKSFVRLVIPFICWGLLGAYLQESPNSITSILAMLFRRPDTGLWFLLCIFYCILVLNILQGLIYFFKRILPSGIKTPNDLTYFLIISLLWLLIQSRLGNGSGFYAAKSYFIYFLLGLGFFKFLMPHIKTWMYLIGIPGFIFLASCWHRTKPYNFVNEIPSSMAMLMPWFSMIVALCGICAMLFIISNFEKLHLPKAQYALAELGKLSLGIYAMHYYFIELYPPILIPIFLSAALSLIILRIPVLRVALLGEGLTPFGEKI